MKLGTDVPDPRMAAIVGVSRTKKRRRRASRLDLRLEGASRPGERLDDALRRKSMARCVDDFVYQQAKNHKVKLLT